MTGKPAVSVAVEYLGPGSAVRASHQCSADDPDWFATCLALAVRATAERSLCVLAEAILEEISAERPGADFPEAQALHDAASAFLAAFDEFDRKLGERLVHVDNPFPGENPFGQARP